MASDGGLATEPNEMTCAYCGAPASNEVTIAERDAAREEAARLREEAERITRAELELTKQMQDARADLAQSRRDFGELRVVYQGALATLGVTQDDLAAAKATIATLAEERDEALAEADRRAADSLRELDEAHKRISAITTEEQKWRDSFFAAIVNRDTMRLALSAVAGDPCDEPYTDGHAPCGCCRSHIKTARRALDE